MDDASIHKIFIDYTSSANDGYSSPNKCNYFHENDIACAKA